MAVVICKGGGAEASGNTLDTRDEDEEVGSSLVGEPMGAEDGMMKKKSQKKKKRGKWLLCFPGVVFLFAALAAVLIVVLLPDGRSNHGVSALGVQGYDPLSPENEEGGLFGVGGTPADIDKEDDLSPNIFEYGDGSQANAPNALQPPP
eukprot:CAMPEP_0183308114 /NCGR_PEP_ID=MMETSP0160_2-20130417/19856_1 /TAXON_ID=2839 ORGANISM="Odontella Sinensis, Strain Grunow 1884" /NCGR_SAMPLE_ID=MMETSP0160_2 /ASSEMBLY_ACC=CAM_ASM_000250 /LENGTH=147 /DNA_ID=CAMNT_0025471871 /DNA_START=71 /DNA_END=514 /DNA_ORIENTATION=+